MGNGGLPHVTEIQQRDDNTISLYIQTDSFKPGQEVEVSVYLTQGHSYAFYNDKKRIPFPSLPAPTASTVSTAPTAPTASTDLTPPTQLHVELPATKLDARQPVTVVTRVTEVWSTVLEKDPEKLGRYKGISPGYADLGLTAVWTYQDDKGKESGDM
jgi:hypothetical protein